MFDYVHMSKSALRGQRSPLGLLELEVQVFMGL